jgi:hypothetical protein
MTYLENILRTVAQLPYYLDEGSRGNLFKDAVQDPNAFIYSFDGNKLYGKTIGFSAHIDTAYQNLREFQVLNEEYHGTMDNAAGVALLLMLKEEIQNKSFSSRNKVKLFFTREEEGIGSDFLFSASNLRKYAEVDLIVVVDVRPKTSPEQKNVLIENCYPSQIIDIAKSISGDVASIRTDGFSPDEAVEYSKNMSVMSIGPVIEVRDKKKEVGAFWHNPDVDSFVRKSSMQDCYYVLKRIANKEI